MYHLTDDTNHDSVLTFHIIGDIIKKYPEIIKHGKLVIRSDNCSTQYKCKYVFQKMGDIATKYNIVVAWFYGVAGHGKGTIDAMSSFGCKRPLAQMIIGDDYWFASAKPMVDFLKDHFKDDDSKEHHFVDSKLTADERCKKGKECKIKNC